MLKMLKDLLEHENLQVRTYVNGTLYSILTRAQLKESARMMGLEHTLAMLMQHSDEQFQRQIQYILD